MKDRNLKTPFLLTPAWSTQGWRGKMIRILFRRTDAAVAQPQSIVKTPPSSSLIIFFATTSGEKQSVNSQHDQKDDSFNRVSWPWMERGEHKSIEASCLVVVQKKFFQTKEKNKK